MENGQLGFGGTDINSGAPFIATAYASSADTHTTNFSVWEDINSMRVVVTPKLSGAKLFCTLTIDFVSGSANWEHYGFRFDLDGQSQSEAWLFTRDSNPPSPAQHWTLTIHTVFSNVNANSHVIKAQWSDNGSSQDVTFSERRLTVMVCQ